ncbi:MAG: Bax inhibitor-1/YccA family protein [Alphaproteobacteria bacterium]|nr:Bax inhibitor-1/YccA family protein [Alphaproteobacteria bacterium]
MIDRNFSTATKSEAQVDQGLRSYMLRVYNYMATGLGLTGLTAYFVAITPSLFNAIYGTPFYWIVALAPLGFVFYLSARLHKISFAKAQTVFWIFSGVMGLSMAYIFIAFTGASIARVFFITAGTFAGMSLYGYTTKKDLTGWGSFLFMGLIGIIIAMIVNIFLQSGMLSFIISCVGVLIFVGLTAYDTQRIKEMYYASDHPEISGKKAIMGALKLYLDFINLFIMLLHLFGQRR